MSKRSNVLTMVAAGGAFFALPAHAQSTLDRVAPPARTGERDPAPELQSPPTAIEVSTPVPPTSDPPAITVGAVALNGLTILSLDKFAGIITDFVGRSLTPADLESLTNRIAQRARDLGFVFATARIAPQRLAAGVLVVEIDEGVIDRVDIQGSNNAAVKAALAPLASGRPVKVDDLERRLLIAGDIDGIKIRRSRFVREAGRGVLIIDVVETGPTVRVTVRNDGTRPVGPIQIDIEEMLPQLLFADDSLALGVSTAPLDPRELITARARYEKRLNTSGLELSLASSFARIRPGSYLSGYDILGTSWSGSVALLQPLLRRRQSSLWLTGSAELNGLTQSRGGTLARRDRTTVLRLGIYGYENFLGGRLRASAVFSQGVAVLGATDAGDPFASRPDSDGTFTSVNIWAEWTRPLGSGFSVRLAGDTQLSSKPLLVSEEVALGGGGFLRGYDWSERSGDKGTMGSVEARYDVKRPFGIAERAQVYVFGDAGIVNNLADGIGGGSLASAGGGIRLDVARGLGANAGVAVPLSGVRYDTGNRQPRINLGISKSF